MTIMNTTFMYNLSIQYENRAMRCLISIKPGCARLLHTSQRCRGQPCYAKQSSSPAPQGPHCPTPVVKASRIPTPDEDREVAHSAYLHAFQKAQPEKLRIHGMQEFASALLARSRIPSQQYTDPLMHIFDEFDRDKNGHLSAAEVAAALQSRDVKISEEQAQMFIEAVDLNSNHTVERSEFRELILHMAAADLHMRQREREDEGEELARASVDQMSWESDEEIQMRLKGWVENIMMRRYK